MSINVNSNIISGSSFNSSGDILNSPTVVTDGLVLWYDAGNNASYINSSSYYDCGYGCQYYGSSPGCTNCNTQIKDMSGFGNDGTLQGATITYDNTGGLMNFNGTSDYITMGSTIDFASTAFSNGFSIDLFVYPTTPASLAAIFSSAYNTSGGNWQLYIWYNSNKFGTAQRYSGLQNDFTCNGTYAASNWYNVNITSNNSTCIIYINGISDGSNGTGQPTNQPADREVRLCNFKGYPAQYPGKITSCRVYNRALTATEVLQNFNSSRQRFGV